MAAESELEHQFDHYLQGHFHPDIEPHVRREVRLGTVSIEGFMRLAGLFQANHEALDDALVHETFDPADTAWDEQMAADRIATGVTPQLEVTPVAQQAFDARIGE